MDSLSQIERDIGEDDVGLEDLSHSARGERTETAAWNTISIDTTFEVTSVLGHEHESQYKFDVA